MSGYEAHRCREVVCHVQNEENEEIQFSVLETGSRYRSLMETIDAIVKPGFVV